MANEDFDPGYIKGHRDGMKVGREEAFKELRGQIDQRDENYRRLEELMRSQSAQLDEARILVMRHGLDCEFKVKLKETELQKSDLEKRLADVIRSVSNPPKLTSVEDERVAELERQIGLWREFAQLLANTGSEAADWADIHGWQMPPGVYERATNLREMLGLAEGWNRVTEDPKHGSGSPGTMSESAGGATASEQPPADARCTERPKHVGVAAGNGCIDCGKPVTSGNICMPCVRVRYPSNEDDHVTAYCNKHNQEFKVNGGCSDCVTDKRKNEQGES